MTDRSKIDKAWKLERSTAIKANAPQYEMRWKVPIWEDLFADVPVGPAELPTEPIAGTYVIVTFDACGYVHQGMVHEWWNVVCEGQIIDMIGKRYEPY